MGRSQEFEVFSDASNAVVARHPGRKYAGVLIQGDSLRALLGDVEELADEARAGDVDAVREVAGIVVERIRGLLAHDEATLDTHGRPLPYSRRVSEKAVGDDEP